MTPLADELEPNKGLGVPGGGCAATLYTIAKGIQPGDDHSVHYMHHILGLGISESIEGDAYEPTPR